MIRNARPPYQQRHQQHGDAHGQEESKQRCIASAPSLE